MTVWFLLILKNIPSVVFYVSFSQKKASSKHDMVRYDEAVMNNEWTKSVKPATAVSYLTRQTLDVAQLSR